MIYIRKKRTPQFVKAKRDEIINTPDSGYEEIVLPKDSKQMRVLFGQMTSVELRKSLCEEQHGLCAYCMRKIVPQKQDKNDEEVRVEHYVPLSKNKDLALDYSNFLGVCYGGNKDIRIEGVSFIACCDAYRGERDLTISPWEKRQMEAIAYRRDGFMFVKTNMGLDPELVEQMQRDINEVLHLNGEVNEKGEVINDTTSRLVANRKKIRDSVESQVKRWEKHGCLSSTFLEEEIDTLYRQLQDNNDAEPFIGARIYYMEKVYKSLKRRGK